LLDCPVPRLTLLFFGAAKDVPEAAKMVTAGTAPPTFQGAILRPNTASSNCASPPENVRHQRNHGYDQQEVNQPTGDVERKKSQQPHYKQNDK
jgi:hypothetical protein